MKTTQAFLCVSLFFWSGVAIAQEPQQAWPGTALAGVRELLSEKRFADARDAAERVIQALLQDDHIAANDERAALTEAVAFRAVAESRTMRNDLAEWDWYVAANLSPDYAAKLHADLDEAGAFPKLEHLWDRPPDARLPLPKDVSAMPPKIVKRAELVYPMRARRLHIESAVVVESLIDRSGQIRMPRIVTPDLDPSLVVAALDALSKWVFEPGRLAGKPVTVIYHLTINFKLDPQS
jgi:TonB family protein